MLVMVFAFGALAEIFPALSGKPLFNRGAVISSLVAVAVIGTLAWLQNMLTAPIGIGWMYFGMLMALALLVPFGVLVFNLISTLVGGALQMRAPLLFGLGALSLITIGLTAEIAHSMVAVAWELKNTTDATGATHYALVGGAVMGGFAALSFWFPKLTGRTMGEYLSGISFWTMFVGANLAFFPLFLAGVQGQVVDAYKYFSGTGVSALQPDRLDRHPDLLHRRRPGRRQRGSQPQGRRPRRPRPLGRGLARVVHALAASRPQLRRPPRRPQRPAPS